MIQRLVAYMRERRLLLLLYLDAVLVVFLSEEKCSIAHAWVLVAVLCQLRVPSHAVRATVVGTACADFLQELL